MSLDAARRVADAVLYEGYLLYPYRAGAVKNRTRWQFGVLGPPRAAGPAFAEPPSMSMDCLLSPSGPGAVVTIHLRFLQLQAREVRDGSDRPVDRLTVAGEPVLSWAEAVEHELILPPVPVPVPVPGAQGSPVTAEGGAAGRPISGAAGTTESPISGVGGDADSPAVGAGGDADFPAVGAGGGADFPAAGAGGGADFPAAGAGGAADFPVTVAGGAEDESLGAAGRVVRRRWPLAARVHAAVEADGELVRLTVRVTNEHPGPVADKDEAVRCSLLGTHLLVEARDARFVSVQDPPPAAAAAARRCRSERCWPVLAGSDAVLLGAPIILYDHPEVAAESPGDLFDSTEIDEILTLRVMTMTEAEKAEARATDPRARAIVDRCDAMSPAGLQRLHGAQRPVPGATTAPLAASPPPGSPPAAWQPAGHAGQPPVAQSPVAQSPVAQSPVVQSPVAQPTVGQSPPAQPAAGPPLVARPPVRRADRADRAPVGPPEGGDRPWWDPAADAAVDPETASVLVDGVPIGRGSLVRVHPSRRADAQDLFFAGQGARVTAVVSDVDGATHVAVVLVDDPAADLHEWYGRYFYFAPDELEPLDPRGTPC